MAEEPMINGLLRRMLAQKGSDLHLATGSPAKFRVHGGIHPADDVIIDAPTMGSMLKEICIPAWRWDDYLKRHDLDFAHEIPGLARFRCNFLYNYTGQGAVLRQIPSKILTLEDLKLPKILKEICSYKSGLVLVTGPTGSGKSTTLAAMLDYINENYSKHIITIEDPVEFVHQNKKCTIVHREVGIHSESFPKALRGAMRSDPDIVLIGEMRELETIRMGLTCASMGMLVFATLHTNNAPKTIDRIIDAFPANEQAQIRTMLAACLQAVVSQLLCKKVGGGRIASHEVLLWADGLPNTIREGQINNIRTIIESNKGSGMQSMDGTLQQFLDDGLITLDEAYLKASDKKRFDQLIKERDAKLAQDAAAAEKAALKAKK